MDLHEELERRARKASAAAADRLGATAAGDALVALVGRRRRRRATVVTGASVACVAALVVAALYIGPWSPSATAPAGPPTTATTVIDASTPLADGPPLPTGQSGDSVPVACGDAYTTPSGATRQVDGASRWPVTVTASATVNGSNAAALGPGVDPVTWTAQVSPRAAVEDLAFTAYAVVEHDGRVAASKPLGSQEPAGSGVMGMLNAPVPGLCGRIVANTYPDDGEYTFHLWVQVVDSAGTPVATVVDPVEPVTLNVTGIADYWNSSTTFNGLPNLSLDPVQCGDPSSAEGRFWDDAGYSADLPVGATMPGWSASLGDGSAPTVSNTLDAPLTTEESFAIAQAFGVVDGVVVAVGEVRAVSDALNYSASLDLSSPCGVSSASSMDVYVLQEALIAYGSNVAPVEAAVVFRVGPIDVSPEVGPSLPVTDPPFSLADNAPKCGDEWALDPSFAVHSGTASGTTAGVSLRPAASGGGWDVTLAAPGEVSPNVGWMAASFAVAGGRVVGVSAPVYLDTPAFDTATIASSDMAACSADTVGEVTGAVSQHVVVQAVTPSDPLGPRSPVATWVDPFGS